MTELVFREDPYARACEARITVIGDQGVQLDRTVCYFASGGQPGDRGWLSFEDGRRLAVLDTVRGSTAGEILHAVPPDVPAPRVGEPVYVEIDWPRRHRLMRLHTSMHLLCAVVSAPVTGGQIHEDRARLDFDMASGTIDRAAIEQRLNELVRAAHDVAPRWITDEELDARPELVRTMSVKPPRGAGRIRLIEIPGVDLQACGGTHVRNTAEIGPLAILDVLSKGKRNRRVVVGFAADS